uniref:Myosin IXA n=1 Tax=Scleropages formosus TaxID=113540 RepID=A0A8C9RMP0_SCLFO
MSFHDAGGRRRFEDPEFTLRIYPGVIAEGTIYCPVTARKTTTAAEAIDHVIDRLQLDRTKCYVLAEVKEFGGEEWILNPTDCPVQRMMLWPRLALENRVASEDYRFLLREKNLDGSIHYGSLQMWLRVTEERRRMVERGFLPPPSQKDYDDLCSLPDLNEKTLLDNLRSRFKQEKIYTYVGNILIVINPFKFLPIYNPKYVKMYDNHQLGKLEPHVYAVADVAYHAMLQRRRNQCIVISGESGSGKTQSTNFLIHHLTALSQKGFASGVEQIILGAGPVLEAFGNAKTAHNNNSSRFGKFIQVNYLESGTVRGAYVEKYLLEKSRLVYQEHNERNYHVFYYLLAGASEEERNAFHLKKPEEYHYLNQVATSIQNIQGWEKSVYDTFPFCFSIPRIFSLLSAILHLGNIRYKKKTYRDDSIDICNHEVLPTVSELLEVKEEMLFEALTTRKTVTVGERLIVPYRLAEAVTVRDSMAKSLYSALFDWIVFRINHALLNIRDLEESAKMLSIGVLDIFGFEDYESNSFEQFCINFANERLQHYFNQHIFKLEQEEYLAEGITWHNIDYIDNSGCINLISKKPTGLLHLLDEECNFPQASNQTLLDKFKRQHEGNSYIEFPAVMEPAFIIRHYAGKVKYGVKDFREKNTDHMRPDIVALLKSSKNAFICSLIGIDPVATFRWAVLRAYFRALVAFRESGKRFAEKRAGHDGAAPCTVLKSVDSFSFLHHPVHQRSLEILQRCKEEKYSITRKSPRMPLSDLHSPNTINEKPARDSFNVGWNGHSGRQSRLSSSGSGIEDDGIFLNSTSSKLLERAHGILMRNKNYKSKPSLPKHLLDVKSLRYLSSLTLHDRITKSLLHLHKKKKPPSISAQFQASLNKLMETLSQSEPYFVKCIRSNAEKLPMRFNDGLVLRQLRYTGMLETVRICQSGYSIKYTFQDFVRHFHVLLPHGSGATQQSISTYLHQVDLDRDGFQVGFSMVFLREGARQRLQDLLHQEVLCRIVALQRRFRALRRRFLLWREAALVIQRSWRLCSDRRVVAACTIQAAWRGYKERDNYLKLRDSVVLLQAAGRGYLARKRFRDLKDWRLKEKQLQNGLVSLIPANEDQTISGLDLSSWEDRLNEEREKSLRRRTTPLENSQEEARREVKADDGATGDPWAVVAGKGRPKVLDDPSQKTRAKRESRRKRELEQAKFSLELLKVRSTGGTSPSEEKQWPAEVAGDDFHSPQGSPDSQSSKASFELVNTDGHPKDKPNAVEAEDDNIAPGVTEQPESSLKLRSPADVPLSDGFSTKIQTASSSLVPLPKIQNNFPTFYIPPQEKNTVSPQPTEESLAIQYVDTGKTLKEKAESSRRPVVVVISMQKETTLGNGQLNAAELQGSSAKTSELSTPALQDTSHESILARLEKLNEEKKERQKHQQQQNEREMMEQIRQQKEILERQRKYFAQYERDLLEKQRGEALLKIEQNRQGKKPELDSSDLSGTVPKGADVQMVAHSKMQEKGSTLVGAKDQPIYTLQQDSKEGRTLQDGWAPKMAMETREGGLKGRHKKNPIQTFNVARPGHKKRARMARTRSDFLTRGSYPVGEGDSEEDEYDEALPLPPPSPSLPLQDFFFWFVFFFLFQNTPRMKCCGATNMSGKTLYKSELVSFFLLYSCGSRVRGKMRFWGKTKHNEKKGPRDKLASVGDLPDGDFVDMGLFHGVGEEAQHSSPPRSPTLAAERGRESKENKEPSPRVKRRRSLKISSAALEPAQWHNDSLHILTSASDHRSMDEFLLKKIHDLDTEDSKKDTMVDVVFKKALKEFRLNIFNSYSTALAMDDGKSIRYKDLYALFEHILEKTMRQEQRDWSESPVKVWVNTFKVFLDEFMTEYKPLDNTVGKVPKPDRKKRRKKETDIVEEHNGHIFKSTQYSIPTYCEFCSSLIWMMDKACVCKLCRYACHRKCCLKMTTKCSKKYDPELSSRQFGVEVTRLTSDDRTVPLVVEKLINYIEMHGLYTEGIYRKSGSTNKIKELKQGLDTDVESMNLDEYNIHVIASVFKQWLRDLPNPLMTFELYEEFLRAMGLQDKKEVIRGVYSVIDQLSRTHLNTLERLIFHLVRIALQEETNRMSANALAIVFAPCILRCPDTIDPLQSVQDISKTTACVELIIVEQMNKYKARLKDISSLEFAESKAKSRLTLIRRSMKPVLIAVRFMSITRSAVPGKGRLRRTSHHHIPSPPVSPRLPPTSDTTEEAGAEEGTGDPDVSEQQQMAMQQEERVLTEQIESLQKEKEELTFEMLTLEPRASDDETLESEASIGTADSSENLNVDSEGRSLAPPTTRPKKSDGKSRRMLKRQPDSLDSIDSSSTISTTSSVSSSYLHPTASTGRRLRFRSKSPLSGMFRSSQPNDSLGSQGPEQESDDRPQFISHGTFNAEKGKQRLKAAKSSPQKHREPPEGGGHQKEPSLSKQMVVYSGNEFMV